MSKPFDVSRFRKSITKSIEGISIGFHDPKTWISTGNYCLNYRISGNFNWGVPLGKVTVFAGEPASGKSLIVSGNVEYQFTSLPQQTIRHSIIDKQQDALLL